LKLEKTPLFNGKWRQKKIVNDIKTKKKLHFTEF
jgi:hypothetical protein